MWAFFVVAGCAGEAYQPPPGFVTNQRIVYSDDLHNENTDLLALDDRILLIFRGGETGQVGSERAHIDVYASMDHGASFTKQSEVSAASLPGMRDIRDPKLVFVNGRLYLYAISRLPGGHYRDLLGQAWTVRAESTDHGVTWSDPVKTASDVDDAGNETFWGFWSFQKRHHVENGSMKETVYALAYDDGDQRVALFSSEDGMTWAKQAVLVDSYEDVPSESELQFFGDDETTAVALVRMDNRGILEFGQTAICTAKAPFSAWECGRRIEQRFDGPTWLAHSVDGRTRQFVVARKHLPCTNKRTAVYELRGDLTDPTAAIEVCEIVELKSAGDTAYTALAPLGDDRFLVSWYSSRIPVQGDVPWLEGQFTASDIWLADLDLSKTPSRCHEPSEDTTCTPPPLPSGDRRLAQSGDYLLALAPVIYPSQKLSFRASVTVGDATIDLRLQALDARTSQPVGTPWVQAGVPLDDDGSFTATFGSQAVAETAFPLLADPFLTLGALVMRGVVTSRTSFCGTIDGYAQVYGDSNSDRITLTGSTFGAVAIEGDVLPAPVGACPVL